MKYKANGGYQILNFEGVNITSLTSIDFNVVKSAILREKTIQVIDLVVGTEKVNGVADASYDGTNDKCVLTIALKVIEIANDSTLTISDVKTGTEVEANVQLVGDESNLSSIQIGDTKYKVSQVDPSTSQIYDEEIDKLKIDGTIYKIGGGGKLYSHNIQINNKSITKNYGTEDPNNVPIKIDIKFTFICSKDTAFTTTTELTKYLYDNNGNHEWDYYVCGRYNLFDSSNNTLTNPFGHGKYIMTNPYVIISANTTGRFFCDFYWYDTDTSSWKNVNYSITTYNTSLSDSITEL